MSGRHARQAFHWPQSPGQWFAAVLVLLVIAVSLLALLGKADILTFWLVIGVAFVYVKYILPRLQERESPRHENP
jgi:hypothetical protein